MDYAILGGGALGLMAAYRLSQAGQSVMLFEQEPLAGGLAAGFRIDDIWLEKFYHHLFRSDTTAIRIIEELGLADRLAWIRPRTVSRKKTRRILIETAQLRKALGSRVATTP